MRGVLPKSLIKRLKLKPKEGDGINILGEDGKWYELFSVIEKALKQMDSALKKIHSGGN